MEELQEADVLWPETPPPPPSRDPERYLPAPELYMATTNTTVDFSYESFVGPAASSSSSTWSVPLLSDPYSDGFLSDPSTATGYDHDAVEEEFQEADLLWPDDDDYTAGERGDGGEFWWLCCSFGDAAGRRVEVESASGKFQAWRPLMSSPIDIPTRVVAAARRHPSTAALVHRR